VQQIWIPRVGDPSVLEVREAADPEPGAGEVRIQVHAAGVNFADLMARMGLYPDAPSFPAVVGYEVAGVIDAVGEGVDEDRVGEHVVCMTRFGGYSSAVVSPAVHVAAMPEGLSFSEAASLPVTGITSWLMIEIMGRVREGDRVLVHSAGGGVGLNALDLLKRRGAWVVGTASAKKHAFLKERGYDQLIDYTTEDFEAVLAGEVGLDLILDPIGGDSWTKGLRLLRAGGRLVCFGVSSNAKGETRSLFGALGNMAKVPWLKMNPITLMNENKGVMGVNMGRMWHEAERGAGWLRELLACVDDGSLRPVVHATVPFSRAREAHEMLHNRENLGKVVLVPDEHAG
jgi:NADPH:quinone reductase-like Zn-dependent oxidoreductase